jgi:hypothetical protein
MQPKPVPQGVNELAHYQLGLCISALDGPHDGRPLLA